MGVATHPQGYKTKIARCAACGEKDHASNRLSIDHIVPLARGGTWDQGNLQILCRQCNSFKADWHPSFGGLPPCLTSQQRFILRSDFKREKILAMMRHTCKGYPEYREVIRKLATEHGGGTISWRDVLLELKEETEVAEPAPKEEAP